ncbi:MAG: DinB family protein [Pseudomonas sp.]
MSYWQEAVNNWDRARRGVAGELNALASDYLDVTPAEGARSAREIALHIMAASRSFVDRLEHDAPFPQLGSKAEGSAELSGPDLARVLLNDWTNDLKPRLEQLAERADQYIDGRFGRQTRLSELWFAAMHEYYHRGQLATYVRLSGQVPALTQFIAASARR